MMEKEKWYKKSWVMWLLLLFLPPVGIILMWVTKREYSTKKKTILSVIFPLSSFYALGTGNSSVKNTSKDQATKTNTTEEKETKEETASETETTTEEETRISLKDSDSLKDYLSVLTNEVEKNTSGMVDKIASIAKQDALTVTDEQLNTAVTFIAENYPNYHSDNEMMESIMYYGYLLDYAYNDNDPEDMLGVDAYEVVKYVYRGAENADSAEVKENLQQIEKDLSAMGIKVAESTIDEETTEPAISIDWDKCIADLKAGLPLSPDYTFVNDYHIEVDQTDKRITITAVVGDATAPEEALDFADTVVRQLNLYAKMQDGSIKPSTKDFYGGIYEEYSLLVGVAPASKATSEQIDEWFVFDSISLGIGKLELQQ